MKLLLSNLIACVVLMTELVGLGSALRPSQDDCLVVDGCSGTPAVVEQEGTICLLDYEKDMDCAWQISSPFIGSVIRLELTYIDIESCSSCSCDYLSAHEGDGLDGDVRERMCGDTSRTVFTLDQDMYLHFYSDHTREAGGFMADVTFFPIPRVGFHAIRQNPLTAASEDIKVMYEGNYVNIGAAFDISTGDFTCRTHGYYYFSIGAGATIQQPVNMILRLNGAPYVSARRTSTRHANVDMLERAVVLELQEGDVVDVILGAGTSIYSDQAGEQTSFVGFLLPHMHEQDAMLFAARPDNTTGFGFLSNMEKRLVDIGGWGSETNKFVVPKTGVYMTQFSTGCPSSRRNDIYQNDETILASTYAGDLSSGTYDTCSGAAVTAANQGDDFSVYVQGSVFTNSELQTSFTSFLVSSAQKPRPNFALARTTDASSPGVISFNIEAQSEDIGINLESGTVTCTVPGHYFIYVTLETKYTFTAIVNIKKNDEIMAMVTKRDTNNDPSLSKSIIFEMEAGDTIQLELVEGELYSSEVRNLVLSGFLLYEELSFLEERRAEILAARKNKLPRD